MRIFSRILNWFRMSDSNNTNNEQQSDSNSLINEFNNYLNRRRTLGYGELGGTNPMYLSNWLNRARSDGYSTNRLRVDPIAGRITTGAKEACERVDAYNAVRYCYERIKHEQLNISSEDVEAIMTIMQVLNKLPKDRRAAAIEWLSDVARFNADRKEEDIKEEDTFEL